MTIAHTGNRIVDAQARKGAAEQKKEAARAKSAARKSGKSGSKGGKFKGAGKAGRAASKRAAKGIKAKYIGKGKSAAGAVDYTAKDDADLIESNCGFDRNSITEGLSPKMRPEIKEQVVHLTFSTPSTSGKATAEQWRDRVEFIRKSIGLDDSFAYAVFRHNDTDHDHIHLLFNRISDQGNLWKDNQIGLRLASLEQKMEQRFALKLTARENFQKHGNMNKKTYEMAVRNGIEPAFLFVQKAIIEAKKDKPDVLTFVARLADKGIAVRPNLKQGELNGLGYSKDGQAFTGKALGVNWMELKKEVNYVSIEHYETLAALKQQIDSGATRHAQQIEPAKPAPAPVQRSEPQVANTLCEAVPTTQDHAEPERKPAVVETRSNAINRLVELRNRMDVPHYAGAVPAPTPAAPTTAPATTDEEIKKKRLLLEQLKAKIDAENHDHLTQADIERAKAARQERKQQQGYFPSM